MLPIQTNIYRRRTRKGRETWVVRWKSPTTGQWQTMTGGRTEQEALLVEARIRLELAQGKDPAAAVAPGAEALTVAEVVARFYAHSRFQSAAARWQKEACGTL